jgi:hypothetical protein
MSHAQTGGNPAGIGHFLFRMNGRARRNGNYAGSPSTAWASASSNPLSTPPESATASRSNAFQELLSAAFSCPAATSAYSVFTGLLTGGLRSGRIPKNYLQSTRNPL